MLSIYQHPLDERKRPGHGYRAVAYESRETQERRARERRRVQEALGHLDESLEEWGKRTFGRNARAQSFVNRKGETVLWVERIADPWEGPVDCVVPRPCKCWECKPPPPKQIAHARSPSLAAAKDEAHRAYTMNVMGQSPEELERLNTPLGPEDFGGSDYP